MISQISRRQALMLGAGALAASTAAGAVKAAPKSRLIDAVWKQRGSGGDPDYGPWAAFLSTYLKLGGDGVIRVAYGKAVADGARAPLREWMSATQQINPATLSADAQFAWWVNLYNAATIDLVLEEYPVSSILKIRGGLFNTGPWTEEVLSVNGVPLSLDNVEHGILRPIWGDARVHYAVNCASIGCPNLAMTPWGSANLSGRLDQAARDYVNDPRGALVEGGKLTVSKIYTWFQEDFGGDDAGVIAHLKQYAGPDQAAALQGVASINDERYDWDLNDI